MKEMIAQRDKKIWIFALIMETLLVLSMGSFVKTFINTSMHWLVIVMIVCISLSVLSSLWGLFGLPNYVIVKEDENLVIHNGIRKQTLCLRDIVSVELPPKEKPNYRSLGMIILRANTEKGEKNINIFDIKNPESVVEKINQLLKNKTQE